MKPDLTLIPARPDVGIHKRKPLTRSETIALVIRQMGWCGCGKCDAPLDPFGEGVIDEHLTPLDFGGSNDLTNRALLRLPCAKAKTVGDNAGSKKINRLRGELKPKRKRDWPSRTMQSRGFEPRRSA